MRPFSWIIFALFNLNFFLNEMLVAHVGCSGTEPHSLPWAQPCCRDNSRRALPSDSTSPPARTPCLPWGSTQPHTCSRGPAGDAAPHGKPSPLEDRDEQMPSLFSQADNSDKHPSGAWRSQRPPAAAPKAGVPPCWASPPSHASSRPPSHINPLSTSLFLRPCSQGHPDCNRDPTSTNPNTGNLGKLVMPSIYKHPWLWLCYRKGHLF